MVADTMPEKLNDSRNSSIPVSSVQQTIYACEHYVLIKHSEQQLQKYLNQGRLVRTFVQLVERSIPHFVVLSDSRQLRRR